MLISLNVWLIKVSGNLNIISSCFFDGMCVVPLALAAMTRNGSTCQPCWMMLSINGRYFWDLLFMVSWENLSFVYWNTINCIVRLYAGSGCGVSWRRISQGCVGLSIVSAVGAFL